jgi:hypothetical protein
VGRCLRADLWSKCKHRLFDIGQGSIYFKYVLSP